MLSQERPYCSPRKLLGGPLGGLTVMMYNGSVESYPAGRAPFHASTFVRIITVCKINSNFAAAMMA